MPTKIRHGTAEIAAISASSARIALKNRILERLLHLFSDLSNRERIQDELVDIAMEAIPCEAASLLLSTSEKGDLVFAAVRGPVAEKLKGMRLQARRGLAGACLADRRPIAVSDVERDPRHAAEIAKSLGFKTRSLLAVPLLYKDKGDGVIELVNKTGGDDFPRHEIELVERVARTAATLLRLAGEKK